LPTFFHGSRALEVGESVRFWRMLASRNQRRARQSPAADIQAAYSI
jgi:hypothetical protein